MSYEGVHEAVAVAGLIVAFPRAELRTFAHKLFEVEVVTSHALHIIGHAHKGVVAGRGEVFGQLLQVLAAPQHRPIERALGTVLAVHQIQEMRFPFGLDQAQGHGAGVDLADSRCHPVDPRRQFQRG